MSEFVFDLQAFAWSQVSEESWLYTSGSNSFYLNGDFDEDEDDNGNTVPQGASVSGSNATIEPDWTTSISVVSGSFNFFDEYESFEAKLSAGEQAVNDEENAVWNVTGAGYVYYSYTYYDSDITVTDLDGAPNNRMTLTSNTSSDGFTHFSINVHGAEVSDYTDFSVGTIACKRISNSGDNYSIIPNIASINVGSRGPTFIADDYDQTEYTAEQLNGVYCLYDSSTHVLTLIGGAPYFADATTLDIEVDGMSSGIKIVNEAFVAFVANEEIISINTDDPIYVSADDISWVWDASGRTLYFDTNSMMTGVSNVSANTTVTLTDEQIRITGATLTRAAIDEETILGTDTNPSNGYIININDDGTYEFAEDSSTAAPTVAAVTYNANGTFTFTDTEGNTVDYSTASVDFTTMSGALVLGEESPLDITISSSADGLVIYDIAVDNTNIVAQLNIGDVFANEHISTDANATNAWSVFEDGDVGLGVNAATTISNIDVSSATTIVRTGNLISIHNATLASFARINGNVIDGEDNDPSDGYAITISGDEASYVSGDDTTSSGGDDTTSSGGDDTTSSGGDDTTSTAPTVETGELASIGYNGTFTFADADGNSLAYSDVSSLLATGSGGLITLRSSAPDVMTITSAVDDLYIYNENDTQVAIKARINNGDSYVGNTLTGLLNDVLPTNSWLTNDSLNVINVGDITLTGVGGISSLTSVLLENNLLVLENITLDSASQINGSAIGGSDNDPSDGYFISLGSSGWSFLEETVSPWSSVEGGFVYSTEDAEFTLLGAQIVDSDKDGAPDDVSVNLANVETLGTIMILAGLNGEVSLNGQPLGILGDNFYSAGFIIDGFDYIADSFSNISGGATIDNGGAMIITDGDGTYTFGDGVFTVNDAVITVDNNNQGIALVVNDETISAVGNLQNRGIIDGVGDASVSMTGSATINGIEYSTDDPNGIVVSGSTVGGLDENALLYITPSGTYVVNSTTIELTSDTAVLGINETIAATTNPADIRARKIFSVPDDTEFISASQVQEIFDAGRNNTIGGTAEFDGNKIIELNDKNDIITVDLTDNDGRKFIVIDGGGDQIVILSDEESNGVLVESYAEGQKLVNGGDKGDTLINNSTAVEITLKGGAGDDSIIAAGGGTREVIDLSDGGSDTVNASSGALIRGYDPTTGAAFSTPITKAQLLTAIENDSLTFGNGTFSISGAGETTISGSGNNLLDTSGNVTRVKFANRSNMAVELDEESIDQLLYGDLAELTLLGSTGNDTILAGEGSLVDGGAGNDLLKLRAEGAGSDVVVSDGEDTVEVFTPDWDSVTSDRMVLGNNRSTISYSFSNNDLRLSIDSSTVILPSIKTDSATKLFTSATVKDSFRRTVLIDESSTYVVASADDRADQYIGMGKQVAVDLSSVEGDDTIELDSDNYRNIVEITVGSGANSVIGTDGEDTITAGLGRSTINSGDGNDMLFGSTSEEKIGGTTFVYTNGLDTLNNFEALGDNADTADEIVYNAKLTNVEVFGNDLVIEAGSVDQLTIVDGANSKVRFNGFVFEVGDDLTYGDDVDGYIGMDEATLSIGESGGNVWTNGVLGGMYSNIRVVNGSDATADSTLVGDSSSNVIYGGLGNNSLWGGIGGDDTLVGGLGVNGFYYALGNGNDVVTNARDDDVINLLGIGVGDIAWFNVDSDSIGLRFNDGGSLTVNSRAEVQFELSGGSRWSANRSDGSWYSRN